MKTYSVPTKLEKHLKRNKSMWSKKGMIALVTYSLALILLGVMSKSCWDGYWRTHSWRWDFEHMIKIQSPLDIREIKPVSQKMLSPMAEEPNVQPKVEIKPILSSVQPFRKLITPEANTVREKLLPIIAKDYPNVDDQVSLDNILKKEAGYRTDAKNGCVGMAQVCPLETITAEERLGCPLDYSDEAVSCQYKWIKNYIANRYQTPSLAWQFHLENNWY